jgi:hypothetical protein
MAFALGLLLAVAAALALWTLPPFADPAPHDHIDEASRRALDRVLREEGSP